MPYDAPDWFLRFHAGLPARPEDRDAIMRFAPELFSRNFRREDHPLFESWPDAEFWNKLILWATAEEGRRFREIVTVRQGSCPEPDCPLKLGRSQKPSAQNSAST